MSERIPELPKDTQEESKPLPIGCITLATGMTGGWFGGITYLVAGARPGLAVAAVVGGIVAAGLLAARISEQRSNRA